MEIHNARFEIIMEIERYGNKNIENSMSANAEGATLIGYELNFKRIIRF